MIYGNGYELAKRLMLDDNIEYWLNLQLRRPISVEQSKKSFEALFTASTPNFNLAERHNVGLFVALLHQVAAPIAYFKSQTDAHNLLHRQAIEEVAATAITKGPYGHYRDRPLAAENQLGPHWQLPLAFRQMFGEKLSAALEHSHLLVYHPRDAQQSDIQKLLEAGWTSDGIVSLAQLISFLAYQIRVIAGYELLRTYTTQFENTRPS